MLGLCQYSEALLKCKFHLILNYIFKSHFNDPLFYAYLTTLYAIITRYCMSEAIPKLSLCIPFIFNFDNSFF